MQQLTKYIACSNADPCGRVSREILCQLFRPVEPVGTDLPVPSSCVWTNCLHFVNQSKISGCGESFHLLADIQPDGETTLMLAALCGWMLSRYNVYHLHHLTLVCQHANIKRKVQLGVMGISLTQVIDK